MTSHLPPESHPFWHASSRGATAMEAPALQEAWRFRVMRWVVYGVFLVLLARAFYLQVIDQHFIQNKGDAMIMRTDKIRAYRGMIRDRNGVPLAVSTPMVTLWMDVKEYHQAVRERRQLEQELAANPDSQRIRKRLAKTSSSLDDLASALNLDAGALKRKVAGRPNTRYLVLARQFPPQDAQRILDQKFQSVYRTLEYHRFYPQPQPNAQLLGITNSLDQGIEGLEMAYNKALAGQDGKIRVMRDKLGNRIKDVEMLREAVPGKDLSLSIDSRLQYILYRELAAAGIANKARSASAVALDVETGEILAMASWPSFNPNDSVHGFQNKDAMRNRAVIDMFEPGSTMKPLTVAAALESGKYTPKSMINTSPGTLTIGRHTIRDHGNLGLIDLKTLIEKSSNVGSAKIALSMPESTLPTFYKRMGFGNRSGLDFPGESPGLILPRSKWNRSEVATMAYGYAINATLIQLAHSYAILGAGGVSRPVTLIKQEGPVEGRQLVSPKIAREVVSMMEGVTQPGGTAPQAAIYGYRVAGKTGTAHKLRPDGKGYSKNEYRALFVGMAPASKPKVVLAIVVENPQGEYYGGLVAAPVFSRVMQEMLRLLSIPMDQKPAGTDTLVKGKRA